MEKIGEIEIRVIGKSGNMDLSPDNYDIRQIASLIQNVEDLLFPNNKKDRPLISYDLKSGSVRNVFKTPIQYVIGFSAVLLQIQASGSIDFLDLKTARAIENIQQLAQQKNYHFEIGTSVEKKVELTISPNSKFFRTENLWADAEFYFYGVLTDAGGKNKANIHLDTTDYGLLTIETEKDYLKKREKNLLYKEFGVRAYGKQNTETGEIDTKSLTLIELIDYNPKFDADYIELLIKKARKSWKGVDTNDWINNLRGGYES